MNVIKQMWINLFGPLWLKEYWFGDWEKFRDRQLDAVKALDDPKKLKRATLESPEWRVRKAAVDRLRTL